MRDFFFKWVVNTLVLFIVVYLASGISVDKWQVLFMAAFILGLLNIFIKPLVLLLTLPLNVLSLGLLTFVINGFMFFLVSKIVEGFHVMSFGSAFWGALLFSAVSFLLNILFNPGVRTETELNRKHYDYRENSSEVIDVEAKKVD